MEVIFPGKTPLQVLISRVNKLKENRNLKDRKRLELVASIAEDDKKIKELEERINNNTQTTFDFQ